MSTADASPNTFDSILAVHVGDAYTRAAYLDGVNQPTNVEDAGELQKFVTPSLVTLDSGGALLGYPALMAASQNTPGPLVWRFSRADLCSGAVSASDAFGRGLTAPAFAALAVRRMLRESTAWTARRPNIVLVVPDALSPLARLNLATLTGDAAELPVAVVSEVEALVAGLHLAPTERLSMVASFDDDALQLRLFKNTSAGVEVVATQAFGENGLLALRKQWFERWNGEVAQLLSGVTAFDNFESVDFEKIWQDIWQCLDTDSRFKPVMPTWTVVRHSTVVPLAFSRAAAEAEITKFLHSIGARVEAMLSAATGSARQLAEVVLVGPTAIGRILAPVLSEHFSLPPDRVRCATNGIYAQGAALRYACRPRPGYMGLAHAPSELGALGVSKDDTGLTFKTLIAAGTPLPAAASFSVMSNRDVQRRLVIKLANQTSGGPVELRYQAEFGPLQGQGMLKVKINVVWAADARVTVTAVDGETEQLLPPLQVNDMTAAGPVLGVVDILRWD